MEPYLVKDLDELEHRVCLKLMMILSGNGTSLCYVDFTPHALPLFNFCSMDTYNRHGGSYPLDDTYKDVEHCQEFWRNSSFTKIDGCIISPLCQKPLIYPQTFEFVVDFNAATKKFKLKDCLKSMNDIYELVYDTENYVKHNYPGRGYHTYYFFNTKLFERAELRYELECKVVDMMFEHKRSVF